MILKHYKKCYMGLSYFSHHYEITKRKVLIRHYLEKIMKITKNVPFYYNVFLQSRCFFLVFSRFFSYFHFFKQTTTTSLFHLFVFVFISLGNNFAVTLFIGEKHVVSSFYIKSTCLHDVVVI